MHVSIPCNSRPGREGYSRRRVLGHLTGSNTLPRRMVRGHQYQTPGGAYGLYVGTAPSGQHWFSYEAGADFARLCVTFDNRWPASSDPRRAARRRAAAVA